MEYSSATIKKKANVYQDGKITSRSIVTANGEMKTLGIMQTGTYRFSTAMSIVEKISPGLMVADLVALIASLDVIAPEIDR